jgi:outer membrane protein assembly factor BamB
MKKNLVTILGGLAIIVAVMIIKAIFKFKPDPWKVEFSELGSSSSPQAADLNGDGIKDIIIGAGAQEFQKTDKAVLALNGKDGSILWKVSARNQVVGSPALLDITKDGVPEVFIGGRSAILFCINGKSGEKIWEYLPDHDTLDILNDPGILNFYNPQFIPDISNDGIEEMLVAYGGYIKAQANDPNRPAGYLMILDPTNGKVLNKASMPDNNEIYMSPVVYDFDGDGQLEIIFGTGGETLNGNLFKVRMASLLKNNLSDAVLLDSGKGKGFIAPPVLADVTSDGVPDIVVNAVNGRALCYNGLSNTKIWEVSIGKGYEVYTAPGPGNFTSDRIPDFFCSFGKGVWPSIRSSVNLTIDGRTGEILHRDTIGTFQYASPIIMDVSEDGYDDVLFALNIPAEQKVMVGSFTYLENRIMTFDMKNHVRVTFDKPKLGTNLGSTPLLTDLDNDNDIDVIYAYGTDASNSYSFKGMAIERIEIDVNPALIRWSSYMNGTNFPSLWTPDPKKE